MLGDLDGESPAGYAPTGASFLEWLDEASALLEGFRQAPHDREANAFWHLFVVEFGAEKWPGGSEHDEPYVQLEAWPYVGRLREAGYAALVDELESRTRREQDLDDLKPRILEAMAATSRPGGQS